MADTSGSSPAVTLAIYAALTYDVISATNSSPQTTEINAERRGDTLMKWVKLGLLQAAGFALLGVIFEATSGRPVWPPILGAGLAGTALWAQYRHALACGLESDAPGTETYS